MTTETEHFNKHSLANPSYVLVKPGHEDDKKANYIEIDSYNTETIKTFLDVEERERDNRVRHLFKYLNKNEDDLSVDRVKEYLIGKYGFKQKTLDSIDVKTKREIRVEEKKPNDIGRNLFEVSNYLINVQSFYEKKPFFYDKSELFWFWNKEQNKYEIVDTVDLMNEIEDALYMFGQTINSKVKGSYIEAFKRVGRKKHPEDAPPKWIQFKDKAFSLNSKNIYQVKPNYFFTNPIPWEIGETSETPVMDNMFEEWVGKEFVQTLYEIIAYCCYTQYPIHRIFALIGGGCNGKSTFQQLLRNFIGIDNCTATELDILLDSRFESAKLYKKLACIMGETNFGVMNKTSLLKKLSGQDLIGFEFKNKKPFEAENYAKLLINSNSMPSSEDTSEGFYRRWIIIDFPNKFKEGKDILAEIPNIEYNNLAKKVCEILPVLLENGAFTNEGTMEERQKKYVMASNPLSMFLKDQCYENGELYVRYSELFTRYVKYLSVNKRRIVSKVEFSRSLEQEGYEIRRTTKDGISDRYIEGLGLKQVNDINDPNVKILNSFSRTGKLVENVNIPVISVINPKPQDIVVEENVTQDIDIKETIFLKCGICGTDTAQFWDKRGNPICELCQKQVNQ